MFHRLINKFKKSLWLLPALYSSIGLLLAVMTITIDMHFLDPFIHYIPNLFLTSVDLAIRILTTLSSSLLTMTTLTFSIIMVVLTTYSSQFSPRALPNFMTEKTTMRVLGVFLGGFIYSIYSLLFMRKSIENEYVISAVIGVFITIICLIFFIHFIHFIGKSIQVDFLIEKLTNETFQTSKAFREKQQSHCLVIDRDFIHTYPYKETFYSDQTAYLEMISIDALLEIAAKKEIFIEFHQNIGEFITPKAKVFSVYRGTNTIDQSIMDHVSKNMTLSHNRNTSQDLPFAIQKLVEIALRATSPGINDPFTAKHCIRNVGRVLAEVVWLFEGDLVFKDHHKESRLLIPMGSLKNVLYYSFYQFTVKERTDLPIVGAIVDALCMTAKNSSAEHKKVLWEFYGYISYKYMDSLDFHDLDEEYLLQKKRLLYELTH